MLYRCEAHLRLNAEKAAFKDRLIEWQPNPALDHSDELLHLRQLLKPRRGRQRAWDRTKLFLAMRRAVESVETWKTFNSLVRQQVPSSKTALRAWMRGIEPVLHQQWALKESVGIVMPHSTGAVENTIKTVKRALYGRSVQFGNEARVNKMLGLVALEIAGASSAERYEELIREHFDAHPTHRAGVDWESHFDKGPSSIDRLIVEAKVQQAKAEHGALVAPKLAARKQQWEATKEARGLQGRRKRPDGGVRYYPAPRGTMVTDIPEIAAQWHPTRNAGLDPATVRAASGLRVWWLCAVDPSHEWEGAVVSRCTGRTRCPFCTGRRAGADNNLAVKFPEIAREWHPTRNDPLTAADVLPASAKLVWWLCPDGHDYQRKVSVRTVQRLRCPDPSHKTPNQGTPTVRATSNRRTRRSRRLVIAGDELLAGNVDASGLAQRALDTAALNAARTHLARLESELGWDMLSALLNRSVSTLRQYAQHPPSIEAARRLAYLVELAEALGPHVKLKAWLERPQSRLGGQAPARLLLRAGDWEPVHAWPGTLMALAKRP